MQYVNKNNLKISRLCLGTVQLGMPYGIANHAGKPGVLETNQLLNSAVEGGITCYDTAIAYGDSENVLGSYFGNQPKPIFITKMIVEAGPNTSEQELKQQIFKAVETSLEQLRISKIPIMMLHNPEILLSHGNIVKLCFRELIENQLVEKAGVSFGADTTSFYDIWKWTEDDLFEAVQIPMNILDHRLFRNNKLQSIKSKGKIVFVRSIFLKGLLFMSPDSLHGPLQKAGETLRFLHELAELEGITFSQLALSFIRDLEEVDSLVIGAETEEQLRDNLQLMKGPSISEKTRFRIMKSVGELPENILNSTLWTHE